MMDRMKTLYAAVGLALLVAPIAGAEDRIQRTFYAGNAEAVHIKLPVGKVVVEGGDQRDIEVDLHLACNLEDEADCQQRRDRLRLVPRIGGRKFVLGVTGTPRARIQGIQAELTVRVPRQLDVEIDVKGGDVVVNNVIAQLEIDIGSGDAEVSYPQDRAGEVLLDVGVGSANLWVGGGRIEGSGFPRAVTWRGSGENRLEIDIASGGADVRLY